MTMRLVIFVTACIVVHSYFKLSAHVFPISNFMLSSNNLLDTLMETNSKLNLTTNWNHCYPPKALFLSVIQSGQQKYKKTQNLLNKMLKKCLNSVFNAISIKTITCELFLE